MGASMSYSMSFTLIFRFLVLLLFCGVVVFSGSVQAQLDLNQLIDDQLASQQDNISTNLTDFINTSFSDGLSAEEIDQLSAERLPTPFPFPRARARGRSKGAR